MKGESDKVIGKGKVHVACLHLVGFHRPGKELKILPQTFHNLSDIIGQEGDGVISVVLVQQKTGNEKVREIPLPAGHGFGGYHFNGNAAVIKLTQLQ